MSHEEAVKQKIRKEQEHEAFEVLEEMQSQLQENHLAEHPFTIEPQLSGSVNITIKTQIQTNRRTNIYLDANWPEGLVNKKMPVYYYPPLDEAMHEQLRSIDDPHQLWLTEMLRYYYGSSTYLEVQFWLKTPEGKMQLILKCGQHPSLIKMIGQSYEEKAVSLEEVKWAKNQMVFAVNFNCTRTCFKSELYVFTRIRVGNLYLESKLTELPFRRSEKRKHEKNSGIESPKITKKQNLKTKSSKVPTAAVSGSVVEDLLSIPALSNVETEVTATPLTSENMISAINFNEILDLEFWDSTDPH